MSRHSREGIALFDLERVDRLRFLRLVGAPVLRKFGTRKWHKVECWHWMGAKGKDGYGKFKMQKKLHYAHRAAYVLFVAPIPDGMTVNHRCLCTSCVNPMHLELVSIAENVADKNRRAAKEAIRMRGVRMKQRAETHKPSPHSDCPHCSGSIESDYCAQCGRRW